MNEDWQIIWRDDHLSFSGTIATTHDLERLVRAFRLIGVGLPSHRKAVAADIGIQERPKPYLEQVMALIG